MAYHGGASRARGMEQAVRSGLLPTERSRAGAGQEPSADDGGVDAQHWQWHRVRWRPGRLRFALSQIHDREASMNDPQRQTVGPWTLHERLGHGGNASVWKATRPGAGTAVALKLINTTKIEREPYQRFVREIEFLRGHQDVPGLLP